MIIEINTSIIGRNLRFLREKYELPTIALSKLIGIPEPCIRAMEKELYVPPMTEYQLKKLCDVLNIPMEHLIQTELEKETVFPFKNKDPYNTGIKI